MRFSNVIELDVDEIELHDNDHPGIYEIGFWVEPNYFVPRYLGRARGSQTGAKPTTIRMRLKKHASGKGNKNVARALEGDLKEFWLEDPDDLSATGKQKMKVGDTLWCRWMVARDEATAWETASARESNMLGAYGVRVAGTQYVWNIRED